MQKKIDLVNGPVLSSLTRLAVPIMATSLIQMAYNMTDMIWIGRIGSSAVASVGAAGMYMWLSNGLAALAKMGGQVNVGHALGASNSEEAAEYASNVSIPSASPPLREVTDRLSHDSARSLARPGLF